MVKPRAIGVLLALALVFCGVGCHSSRSKNRSVNFSFANLSTNTFNSVELVWEGPHTTAGTLAPRFYKTIFHLPWPNVSKAILRFVDDKTGKLCTIDLALVDVDERIQAGKCSRVVLRILDFDRAEVTCE